MDMPVAIGMQDEPKAGERMKELMDHISDHVVYPASKDDIVKSCNMMEHVPDGDKKWVMDILPDGMYKDAGEVRDALEKQMATT